MKLSDKIVWNKFLERHDLVWDTAAQKWYDAPFLGNGFLGATLYFNDELTKMFINLGHTCVYDNREIPDVDEMMIMQPRLPVGKIAVSFKGFNLILPLVPIT